MLTLPSLPAHSQQDKKYDKDAGIKSTALYIDGHTKEFLSAFAISQISLLSLAGYMNEQGPLFYMVAVGGAAAHSAWQIATLKEGSTSDAWSKFISNFWLGSIVTTGILVDVVYKRLKEKGKSGK